MKQILLSLFMICSLSGISMAVEFTTSHWVIKRIGEHKTMPVATYVTEDQCYKALKNKVVIAPSFNGAEIEELDVDGKYLIGITLVCEPMFVEVK